MSHVQREKEHEQFAESHEELEEAVEVSQYRFRIGDKTEGGDNYFVQTERGEYIIADVFTVNAGWVEGIESASAEYFE